MANENTVRSFLEHKLYGEKLQTLCKKYGIQVEDGETLKDLLAKTIIKRADDGDKDAAEIVKEYGMKEIKGCITVKQ